MNTNTICIPLIPHIKFQQLFLKIISHTVAELKTKPVSLQSASKKREQFLKKDFKKSSKKFGGFRKEFTFAIPKQTGS